MSLVWHLSQEGKGNKHKRSKSFIYLQFGFVVPLAMFFLLVPRIRFPMTYSYSDSSYSQFVSYNRTTIVFAESKNTMCLWYHISWWYKTSANAKICDLTKNVSPDISPKMCRPHGCAEHKLSSEQALHVQSENCFFFPSMNIIFLSFSPTTWKYQRYVFFLQGGIALTVAFKIVAKIGLTSPWCNLGLKSEDMKSIGILKYCSTPS